MTCEPSRVGTAAAVFRPPLAGAGLLASLAALGVYGFLKATADPTTLLGRYPFGFAASAGLLWFGLWVLGAYRRSGIRVDDSGIEDLGSGLAWPWKAIEEIRIESLPASNGRTARVAVLQGPGGVMRFGNFDVERPRDPSPAHNLSTAPFLLAVVARKTQSRELLPPSSSEGEDSTSEVDAPIETPGAPSRGAGPVALLLKAGPKVGKVGLKLLKTIKAGPAALAVSGYALIFSWQFAVALVVMILVHECGHVYAMWRSGIPVKGIYLVPFMGGAAVGEGVAASRAREAYVAINGPIWGTWLALACGAVYAATGVESFAALAAWGALINLFNLLPIFPLDGGRILNALAHSAVGPWGVPLTFASLVFGGALAYLADFQLLVLMVLIGLFEFTSQVAAQPIGPALALMGGRPLTEAELTQASRLVSPRGPGLESAEKNRWARLSRLQAEARQTSMTPGQLAWTLFGYGSLAALLVALLVVTGGVEGGGSPLQFLE